MAVTTEDHLMVIAIAALAAALPCGAQTRQPARRCVERGRPNTRQARRSETVSLPKACRTCVTAASRLETCNNPGVRE